MDKLDNEINLKLEENFRVMGIVDETKIEEIEEKTSAVEVGGEKSTDIVEKEVVNTGDKQKMTEEDYNKIITQAYAFASVPLLKLIKLTTGDDYTHFLFEKNKVLKKSLELEMRRDDEKTQFSLYLDIVDKDYKLNYGKYADDKDSKSVLANQCTRLVSFVQILYNHIRDKNKELLEYHLMLDTNHTLFLDSNTKKRIGIRFESRKYVKVD